MDKYKNLVDEKEKYFLIDLDNAEIITFDSVGGAIKRLNDYAEDESGASETAQLIEDKKIILIQGKQINIKTKVITTFEEEEED